MKKQIVVFFAVSLLYSNVHAECDQPGFLDCGTTGDVSWHISSDGKTLTVSGNGAMENYTACEVNPHYDPADPLSAQARTVAPWGKYNNQIETINVEKGVTSLGSRAFQGLDHVTDVSLPDGLETIGSQAFDRAKSITNITSPDSVSDVGYAAFAWTSSLQTVDVGDGITFDKRPFYGVGEIGDDIRISGSDMDLVETAVYCKSGGCDNLGSDIDIGNLVAYQYEGGRYVVGNTKYKNSADMQQGIHPVKRIYSIQEATEASKKTGNTIKIRYK